MDATTKSLLNVCLSVLAPVGILSCCSTTGPKPWELGPAWALGVALSLPIAYGAVTLVTQRKIDPVTLFGLLGTLLTGVISLYANTGDGAALRPDTPWWYAAKEALVPALLGGVILLTGRGEGSLLRVFVYSDALFDIRAIEAAVKERGCEAGYDKILRRASHYTARTLFASGVANFCLSLYFLLPVLRLPETEQAVEYNYAVGSMTWWGYLVIGLPLMVTLMLVIRFLMRALGELTGLDRDRLLLAR